MLLWTNNRAVEKRKVTDEVCCYLLLINNRPMAVTRCLLRFSTSEDDSLIDVRWIRRVIDMRKVLGDEYFEDWLCTEDWECVREDYYTIEDEDNWHRWVMFYANDVPEESHVRSIKDFFDNHNNIRSADIYYMKDQSTVAWVYDVNRVRDRVLDESVMPLEWSEMICMYNKDYNIRHQIFNRLTPSNKSVISISWARESIIACLKQ